MLPIIKRQNLNPNEIHLSISYSTSECPHLIQNTQAVGQGEYREVWASPQGGNAKTTEGAVGCLENEHPFPKKGPKTSVFRTIDTE